LLGNLPRFLLQLCEWLGLRRDPEAIDQMLHPERSPYACPGPRGAPLGNDINFLESPKIDPARLAQAAQPTLAGELSWRPGQTFDRQTMKLARQFGYT
jgi:hypothetical protein